MKCPLKSRITSASAVLFIALVGLSVLTSALAGPKGTDRPIKGFLAGEVTYLFPPESPLAGDCNCESQVTVVTTGWGNLSHLGLTELLSTHCAPMPPYTKYVCTHMTLTAANGDQLYATYDDEDGAPFVLRFYDGTGRFKGAKGEALLDWQVVPMFDEDGNMDFFVPWPWCVNIDGAISY